MNFNQFLSRIRRTPFYVISCFVLLGTLQGCPLGDGGSSFSGKVFDEQKRPIIDATVTMSSDPTNKKPLAPSLTRKTKEGGKFRISRGHAPVKGFMIFEVKKAGYEPYQKQFEAGGLRANLIIILKREEEPDSNVPVQ